MIIIDKNICLPEGRCPLIRTCPSMAIKMGDDGYPYIVQDKCIRCRTCVRHCKSGAAKYVADE